LAYPPLPEQRRIAAILDKADALRTKRRAALAQLDHLAQSMFVEMFGDPQSNPLGWPMARLEDVATKITDGEHQTPERTEHGIKLLSARNIQDGYLDFADVDYVDDAEYQRISKRCKPEHGDVLISCSGSIGRVAPVETEEPLALVRSAALVKPNFEKVTTRFLEMWLRTPFMNREMLKSAKSSSQANLFQGPIRGLPIPLPPRGLQLTFDRQIAALGRMRDSHRSSALRLERLFASLQSYAFLGQV
jgi:type I restriction enzyme S subunit